MFRRFDVETDGVTTPCSPDRGPARVSSLEGGRSAHRETRTWTSSCECRSWDRQQVHLNWASPDSHSRDSARKRSNRALSIGLVNQVNLYAGVSSASASRKKLALTVTEL